MRRHQGTEHPAPLVQHAVEEFSDTPDRVSLPFFRVSERKLLLSAVDMVLAAMWMVAGYRLWHAFAHAIARQLDKLPIAWVVGGAGAWFVISWCGGAYELDTAQQLRRAARVTAKVMVAASFGAFVFYFVFRESYPRPALLVALIGTPLSVLIWRAAYSRVLPRSVSPTRMLVLGNESLYQVLAEAARGRQDRYQLLGFLCDEASVSEGHLGTVARVADMAAFCRAHRVVVGDRHTLSQRVVSVLCECVAQGVEVVEFSTTYEEMTERVPVEHVGDAWLSALPTAPHTSSIQEIGMRAADLLGAGIGLAITGLLFPAIALAILVDSGRPVLYRQERVGLGGRIFTMYKFRSMKATAETEGAHWASRGDGRVTRVGNYLRRAHLDELPQFWNVMRGEMSLVGPRPERPGFTEELAAVVPFYRMRLSVRPGMTGLKQIRVGYAATAEEHLEVLRHDLYFIKKRSLLFNVWILARTVGVVLGMEGR